MQVTDHTPVCQARVLDPESVDGRAAVKITRVSSGQGRNFKVKEILLGVTECGVELHTGQMVAVLRTDHPGIYMLDPQ